MKENIIYLTDADGPFRIERTETKELQFPHDRNRREPSPQDTPKRRPKPEPKEIPLKKP